MLPSTMHAVLLTGHGGFDKLSYRQDVAVPHPEANQVLIKVAASGVNNTDINTRIGWYSKSVDGDTESGGSEGFEQGVDDDGSWSGEALQFPRIQGADICGYIVAVGDAVDLSRLGQRVLVRTMQNRATADNPRACWTMGSECDGGFAQFAVVASSEAYPVNSNFSDIELASFPCAYSTAENLLHRSAVKCGDRVLITGASGGTGSAAIQLAARRGAEVIAVASRSKWPQLDGLGAIQLVDRGEHLASAVGENSIDVVIDLVAGPQWPQLLDVLKPGGRYAVAGAIAGPLVELDVRTLYLKDLTFFGCTHQDDEVFANLVSYIEREEIKPLVAASYPLADIVTAQQEFLTKKQAGKLVLVPPQ